MLAVGELLMNGTAVEWPPRDMNGQRIEIGARVIGARDTWNCEESHEFTVGGLRLQNDGGTLGWVACAYDDADRYFEAWARDCCVTEAAPHV